MRKDGVRGEKQAREILAQAEGLKGELIRIRRDLHRHPELAYKEKRTAKIVAQKLTELGMNVRKGVAGTGVTGLLEGKERGKVVGIRVDMDALPIADQKECPYRSITPGAGHLCGHDAHTAIGMGTAAILASLKESISGSVKFLFQPAEEHLDSACSSGAKSMIEDGALANPPLDVLLGIHLWPEMPVNQIGIRAGVILTGLNLFRIQVKGKKSHTARSDLGVDAILAASHIVLALQSLVSREAPPSEPINLNVGTIRGGQAPNTLAEEVEMVGTVRASNPRIGGQLPQKMKRVVENVAAGLRAEASLDYEPYLPPVLNEPGITDLVEQAAREMFSREWVVRLDLPRLAGDDFAYMAQKVPACYIFLGAGSEVKGIVHPSHHGRFDIDEDCLPVGAALLSWAVLRLLGQRGPLGVAEGER